MTEFKNLEKGKYRSNLEIRTPSNWEVIAPIQWLADNVLVEHINCHDHSLPWMEDFLLICFCPYVVTRQSVQCP